MTLPSPRSSKTLSSATSTRPSGVGSSRRCGPERTRSRSTTIGVPAARADALRLSSTDARLTSRWPWAAAAQNARTRQSEGSRGTVLSPARSQRRGAHRLRTEYGHPDALVAVGNRDPLRERDRSVLGHGVGRRADLRKEAGGGGCAGNVALSACDHLGQHGAGRVDVGHPPKLLESRLNRRRGLSVAQRFTDWQLPVLRLSSP